VDQASDFEPTAPTAGSFETVTDLGVLGRAVPTNIVWFLSHQNVVVIEDVELFLGNKWENLNEILTGNYKGLRLAMTDASWISEAEQKYEFGKQHAES